MVGALFPPGLLFGLKPLSPNGWVQIFPKWPPLEEHMLMIIPETFASNDLPPNERQSPPVFPGDPPRTAVRSDPDSCGVSALPWDLVYMKDCVYLSRIRSLFLPVLWSSCAQVPLAFNAKCSGGSFSQCQIPRHGDLMWGSELSLL